MLNYVLCEELYVKESIDVKINIHINPDSDIMFYDKDGNELDIHNPQVLLSLTPNDIKKLEFLGIIKKEETNDYGNNIGFYKPFLENNAIYMANRMKKNTISYNNTNEVLARYTSLYDFIKQALYIGRKLEPINNPMPECILLYKYNDMYLIKDVIDNKYYAIHNEHPFMKNYKIGDIITEYYEKKELYKTILEQENKLKDGYYRRRK